MYAILRNRIAHFGPSTEEVEALFGFSCEPSIRPSCTTIHLDIYWISSPRMLPNVISP